MYTLPIVTLTHFHFDPLHVQLRLKLSKRTKDITQLLQNDPIHLKIIMHFFLLELLSLLVLYLLVLFVKVKYGEATGWASEAWGAWKWRS